MKHRNTLPHPTQPTTAGIHMLDSVKAPAEAAERLQAAGLLTAGVAHDFNNLLAVILGYCDALGTQPGLPGPALTMIAEINKAATSARSLAENVLALTSGRSIPPLVMDVNASLQQMSLLLATMIGERVELIQRLGDGVGFIEAHPGHFEQILMNLAINARDAMPAGGKLSIETANVYLDEAYAVQHPGDYVRVRVADTGTGMDAETQARIFEPFFTTKPCGQGTGLGLSTVAGIVKRSGGNICVDSRPGCGTNITIHFPRAQQSTSNASVAALTGTILLVEDVQPLRTLTRKILEDAGHTVLEAASAQDALCMAQTATQGISLLITDILMPGLSGFELAQRVTALRPETGVLFMSGHRQSKDRPTPAAHHAFLEKPFTRDKLVAMVAEALRPATQSVRSRNTSPALATFAHQPPRKPPVACC